MVSSRPRSAFNTSNCHSKLATAKEYNNTRTALPTSMRQASAQMPRYLSSTRRQISATASARPRITTPCVPHAILTPFDEVATLTSSAGGAGAVEFERGMRHGPGTTMPFDLMLLVNGSDGTVLQSGCMTIIGK